jgi:hypothetical protein
LVIGELLQMAQGCLPTTIRMTAQSQLADERAKQVHLAAQGHQALATPSSPSDRLDSRLRNSAGSPDSHARLQPT